MVGWGGGLVWGPGRQPSHHPALCITNSISNPPPQPTASPAHPNQSTPPAYHILRPPANSLSTGTPCPYPALTISHALPGYAAAGSSVTCGNCAKFQDCVQPYAFVLAQYLEAPEASHATSTKSNSNSNADSDVDGGAPAALSHLNGEGVLLAMALGPSFVEEKFVHVSPPTLYADSSQLGTVSYTWLKI